MLYKASNFSPCSGIVKSFVNALLGTYPSSLSSTLYLTTHPSIHPSSDNFICNFTYFPMSVSLEGVATRSTMYRHRDVAVNDSRMSRSTTETEQPSSSAPHHSIPPPSFQYRKFKRLFNRAYKEWHRSGSIDDKLVEK